MRTFLMIAGGAALGAGMGLLMSPKGARTRSLIRDKAVKYSHDVQDFAGSKGRHLRNKMKGYAHHAQEAVEQCKEMAHQAVDTMEELQPTIESARATMDTAKSAVHKAKAAMSDADTREPELMPA